MMVLLTNDLSDFFQVDFPVYIIENDVLKPLWKIIVKQLVFYSSWCQ